MAERHLTEQGQKTEDPRLKTIDRIRAKLTRGTYVINHGEKHPFKSGEVQEIPLSPDKRLRLEFELAMLRFHTESGFTFGDALRSLSGLPKNKTKDGWGYYYNRRARM